MVKLKNHTDEMVYYIFNMVECTRFYIVQHFLIIFPDFDFNITTCYRQVIKSRYNFQMLCFYHYIVAYPCTLLLLFFSIMVTGD